MKKYYATLIGDEGSTNGKIVFGIGFSRQGAQRDANRWADTSDGPVTNDNSITIEITAEQYKKIDEGDPSDPNG